MLKYIKKNNCTYKYNSKRPYFVDSQRNYNTFNVKKIYYNRQIRKWWFFPNCKKNVFVIEEYQDAKSDKEIKNDDADTCLPKKNILF